MLLKIKDSRIYTTKFLLLFIIVSVAGLGSIYGYQRYITFVVLPFTLLYVFNFNLASLLLFSNFYSNLLLCIILLSLILLFIVIDISSALDNISKLAGVYFSMLIILKVLSKKYDYSNTILIGYVIAYYVLIYFMFTSADGNEVNISDERIDRGQFDFNANRYSYYSFYANIALFFLIEKKQKRIYILLSILTTFFGIYVSFLTASRSGILFTSSIAIIYWLFIFDAIQINKYAKFFVVLILMAFAGQNFLETYNNSYLKNRIEELSSDSSSTREVLIESAINVFMDYPFTGVGPGQYYLYGPNQHSFSHNSFTEIAANLGVTGLILIVILFFNPLMKALKRYYKGQRDPILKLCVVFFLFFILYNNFYVFYLTMTGMMFFILVLHEQNKSKTTLKR